MFSTDAKDEIARVRCTRRCCAHAFLSALVGAGPGASDRTAVRTRRAAVARAALRASRLLGDRAAAAHAHAERATGPHGFSVAIPSGFRMPGEPNWSRACCRRAWLRGAFLARGSVSNPLRGYHLEFTCGDRRSARAVRDALAAHGIRTLHSRRRSRDVVYVKGAEAVADVLGLLGASQSVFAVDNVRAMRQTKSDIRRRVNGEAANAARAAAGSARQCEFAMRAVKVHGFGALTPQIAQAARLRIAHPDMTLAELAGRARPRVTKSTMGYRMRLLERLAMRSAARR
jgi:DNA-binding transcriptional regulator WhiA